MDRAHPESRPAPAPARPRGRLTLYLGYAAGVGKTCRLLDDGQALRARGVDVVGAWIDTHGRPGTEARIGALERIPGRRVELRGVALEEMDLEAVLARRPAVALVDDVAHTNAPGARNGKRWQDVRDLLAAGIDVIGALDVQDLESLEALVLRSAGVRVRETVPDRLLDEADQLVCLDLGVTDLLDRLREGKLLPTERVPEALAQAYRRPSLAALRELALRQAAESLDRAAKTAAGPGSASPAPGRIMVCLSSSPPRALTLLRRGSRMAGRLNTDWFVVYVRTPGEAPDRIAPDAERRLSENAERARELGAEVVWLTAADPVDALLDFARSHRVSDVLVGRTGQPWWRRLLGRSVMQRMVNEALDLDVHVAALPEDGRP